LTSPSVAPEGRLELTWTNKRQRLLADRSGGYEWTTPGDFRTSEVRLLHDVAAVGAVSPDSNRAADNLLIRGDALHALTSLSKLPEFASEYLGKVSLVYIDPPFNTGQAFGDQYDDALEHSVWLTMMRDRLLQIKELLSPNGTVWVHLDDKEIHRARMVLDEVFGIANFVSSVIWRSADTGNYDDTKFSNDHNYILIYSRRPNWQARGLLRTAKQSAHYSNPDNDPRGPWFDGNPLGSPNPRQNLMYNVESPQGITIKHPPHGWRWQKSTMDSKIAAGDIRFNESGTRIVYRTYLWEQKDLPPSTLWADVEQTGSNRKAKNELKKLFTLPAKEVFATPKPERLMKRIIEIATDPGDIVLDCFAGSGTTAAVAHKLGRRWVTIEWQASTIERFTMPRLEKVVLGSDKDGVSIDEERTFTGVTPGNVTPEDAYNANRVLREVVKNVDFADLEHAAVDEALARIRAALATRNKATVRWTGGGGFRVLDVYPSMFEVEDGVAYLSEWATGQLLTEAVAAQYGFQLEHHPPFSGRAGKIRLAVIDGFATVDVISYLLSSLPANELVAVYATGVDPEAREYLREALPGSSLAKIPASIISSYKKITRAGAGLNWAGGQA
jgi:adenine-specific DNA-methyltransferase